MAEELVRWGRRLLLFYLALLALSHVVRLSGGRFEREPTTKLPHVELAEVRSRARAVERTGETIRVTYREWPAARQRQEPSPGLRVRDRARPVVLLVHGSPGGSKNFDDLGPLLAARGLHVIAPDLPGFGDSTAVIADYSILAHADYCRQLLDRLGLERVHALGFSLGGGVVLELAELSEERSRGDTVIGPPLDSTLLESPALRDPEPPTLEEGPPAPIASLILLSATGVQELELLGHYTINHAVHGAQLALFRAVQELVPHFGLLDRSHVHLSYARNFFDTDQRPLRGILERWRRPMLILHGESDILVPYAAALEHERIVPQSRLVSFDANHFMPFRQPEELVGPIVRFIDEVESGTARTRADARPDRRLRAAEGEPERLPKATGPTLFVWIVLLAVATLVSEDLTCLAAGLLVAWGSLGFWPAVLGCGLGIFFGDLGLYAIGRLGRPFLGHAPLRWFIKPEALRESRHWFERRGALVILLSRFIPGTRLPTYVGAGLLAVNPLVFTLYLLIPVALWTPFLVYISRVAGEPILDLFEIFEAWALPAFLGTLVALWMAMLFGRRLLTWRGRRSLLGAWRRWTRWEFWPRWLFYPPIVLYILYLGLRYRSATLFTATNPGLPAGGGFVGESKSEILRLFRAAPENTGGGPGLVDVDSENTGGGPGLVDVDSESSGVGAGLAPARDTETDSRSSDNARQEGVVAPWRTIDVGPVEKRHATILDFAENAEPGYAAGFPIVLKPDVGERGDGVAIVRAEREIDAFLHRHPEPAIVQRFIDGPELGIFWLRPPREETGLIFSITDKVRPTVIGDGHASLEKLILDDPRAVTLAHTYLTCLGERREDIPAAGEEVELVDLGTHCRGAVFLDGERYRSAELEARIEAIATAVDGFDFGRFDIRAPSYEHFRRGEGLRVLELNGVSSEATHIYDPKHSLFEAWAILRRQWRWAFEIGAAHRDAGHQPLGLGETLRLVRDYQRR